MKWPLVRRKTMEGALGLASDSILLKKRETERLRRERDEALEAASSAQAEFAKMVSGFEQAKLFLVALARRTGSRVILTDEQLDAAGRMYAMTCDRAEDRRKPGWLLQIHMKRSRAT